MLSKKFFVLIFLAHKEIHKHKTFIELYLVWIFSGELLVQFLNNLLRRDFQDLKDAWIGREILGELNFLDIILVLVGWLIFCMFGLDAFKDLFH